VNVVHDDHESKRHEISCVEHDVRVRTDDRCEVVVDGAERIVERLAFVVDRVAIGVQHQRRERIPLLLVGMNRRERNRGRGDLDWGHPILAARARHLLTPIGVIAQS
jgi:hypothetical protein